MAAPVMTEVDIAVVGGGHAGGTLAAILGSRGIRTACIDRDDPRKATSPDFDGRTTAISFGSSRVFEAAGLWRGLLPQGCPIEKINITETGSPTLLEFSCTEVAAPAFGWIFENRILRDALQRRLSALEHVAHLAPAAAVGFEVSDARAVVRLANGDGVAAALIVGADGRASFTRERMDISTRGRSYNQRAVVCIAAHENSHANTAVEDFRSQGPFAILPMQDDEQGRHRSSVVWTEHGPEKRSALHWDEESFTAALQERFPAPYGKVELCGRRFSYPLGLAHATRYTADRMALVADAAHGIHPIAGQGLNLGLRDIAELADLLIAAKDQGGDYGSAALLNAYERARRPDNMAMAAATDGLNALFSNGLAPLRLARKAGLRMIGRMPAAKKFFMLQAMGKSGHLPALIRDGGFRYTGKA